MPASPPPINAEHALARILADGVIAALAPDRPVAELLEMGDALQAAPVAIVTLEMGYANTVAALGEFVARYGANALVGASRVRTLNEALAAHRAGAAFLITEGYLRPVQQHAAERAMLCIPIARTMETLREVVERKLPLMGIANLSMATALRLMNVESRFLLADVQRELDAALAGASGAPIVVRSALRAEDGSWRQTAMIRQARLLRHAWQGERAGSA